MRIYVVPDGKPYSLVKRCAQSAFTTLQTSHFSKLARILGLQFTLATRPKTVRQWILKLLQHIYPDMSDAMKEDILKLRGLKQGVPVHVSELLDPENAAMLDDAFDQDDVQAVKSEVKKEIKRAAARRTPASKPPTDPTLTVAPSGPAASAAGSASASSKSVSPPAAYTPEWMKAFFPVVPGRYIKYDNVRRHRFQCGYPCPLPPYSTTAVFGPDASASRVFHRFLDCVEWAWIQHKVSFPDAECPVDVAASRAAVPVD